MSTSAYVPPGIFTLITFDLLLSNPWLLINVLIFSYFSFGRNGDAI